MATVRKKVDNRIRVQIENGVTLQHRTMFVVVGDRGRDQDFEALTPNLLARTIETVEGGGIVVILLRTMNSLKQLYTMTMAKAVLKFIEAVSEKTLRSTVALTAARGRGKSAAMGLAVAGAHLDYEIIQSLNPEFNKAVVRVNIFKEHRQTIQYIHPGDAVKLGQAELLVIDEAAAIPLPLVKNLLGPYLVFMASTINGYEGTGRSLSLKLIQQLRQQSAESQQNLSAENRNTNTARLAAGSHLLYYVNRDTLFCYHKASEAFLQRLMALYVASHYKVILSAAKQHTSYFVSFLLTCCLFLPPTQNSPNDLQMLSDAPAHHLFCLLPPVPPTQNSLPEVLAVVQMGYGSRALQQLQMYYEGKFPTMDESTQPAHTQITSVSSEVREGCFSHDLMTALSDLIKGSCLFSRRSELTAHFTPYDLKRLELYSRSMVDYHLIMDLIPTLARIFFLKQLGDVSLSAAQCVFTSIQEKAIEAEMVAIKDVSMEPTVRSLNEDLVCELNNTAPCKSTRFVEMKRSGTRY
ncbi:hypothetical protein GOODEAATRI_000714 [Goodea atripinnis]|uniref:RNA cytidine acetyltransferase n=1 Tax=Goodea atripinnis TaxID=208336 RepID=A0ABV0PJR5_9TELE